MTFDVSDINIWHIEMLCFLLAEKPVESLSEEKHKGKKSSDQIDKYRELLKSIQDKDKKKDDSIDMEITWVPGITIGLCDCVISLKS